jgi:phage portal protein BeeE
LNPGAKKKITSGVQEAMAVKSVDRLAVLDEGMTFHPIAITPQEMQIIETQASIEEVARLILHRTK